MDNPEKLATQGTQDTGQINVREYRRGNQKWTIQRNGNIGYTRHRTNKCQRIPKGQSKMDNPEKLATQGTQDEEKQKHSTICVGHQYTQTNTNKVNKT